MPIGLIYIAINVKTGSMYVGKTEQLFSTRKAQHTKLSKTGNTVFYKAIRKYSIDQFCWFVIDETDDSKELSNLEQEYIAYYRMIGKRLYNQTDGGEGILGLRFKNTEQGKLNKSKAQLGNKKWLGKKHTDETRAKMSKAALGKNAKTYTMRAPSDTIVTIINMKQFCKENNLDSRSMFRVLRGEYSQHKGWKLP